MFFLFFADIYGQNIEIYSLRILGIPLNMPVSSYLIVIKFVLRNWSIIIFRGNIFSSKFRYSSKMIFCKTQMLGHKFTICWKVCINSYASDKKSFWRKTIFVFIKFWLKNKKIVTKNVSPIFLALKYNLFSSKSW